MGDKRKWPYGITELDEISELRKNICLTIDSSELHSSKLFIIRKNVKKHYVFTFLAEKYVPEMLCTKEMDEAEIRIVKIVQASSFAHELNELTNKRKDNQDCRVKSI